MEYAKPWYASKTIWGAVVAIAGSLTGVMITPDMQMPIADLLAEIAAAIGGGLAIYGRVSAEKQITAGM